MKTPHLEVILSVFQEQNVGNIRTSLWDLFCSSCAKALGDSEHIKSITVIPTVAPFSDSLDVPLYPKHTILLSS